MKPLVIYHADCADGFGAAFAAWLKLGDEAEYVPMQYSKSVRANLPMFEGREVYILDFSFSEQDMTDIFEMAKKVVWIDHHKTAFEMWFDGFDEYTLPKNAVQIQCSNTKVDENNVSVVHRSTDKIIILLHCNKSGAILAWEYFHPGEEVPMLIKHIDDRDRWQFKLDGTKEFMAALFSLQPWDFKRWRSILNIGEIIYEELIADGTAILRDHNRQVQRAVVQAAPCSLPVPNKFEHPKHDPVAWVQTRESGLIVNTSPHLTSDVGHELASRSGTFGLCWCLDEKGVAKCSLRSNGDYDVSDIAKCYGGGGHKNAAGFSVPIEQLMEWLK